MSDDRPVWTVTELAEAAGVTTARIRQVLLSGEIKGRKHGQLWLIPYEEGQRWLDSRQEKKAPPD